ncbi:DUF4158 domain-containing protein [Streptomyces sp. NPDC004069]
MRRCTADRAGQRDGRPDAFFQVRPPCRGGSRISASAVQRRFYRPARVPITGVTEGAGVRRDLGLDGVVDHFTLSGDEAGWLRNKSGSTRLGFAVQLKFLTWRGRFPKTLVGLGHLHS